jgi:hypothetical protein
MRVLVSPICKLSFALFAIASACGPSEPARLERALVGRGRIAVFGDAFANLHPAGTTFVPAQTLTPLANALAANDPEALISALTQAQLQGVAVDTQPGPERPSLANRMGHFARVTGLQGAYFTQSAAFYVIDPVRSWSPALRAGLATVARRLVAGATPPRMLSFPERVRRLEPVEVMVLLRNGDRPRLWRSARGSSFARALLTAAEVARQRWIERAQALGGPLNKLLPGLTVELALLQDDGEIGVRDAGFVDRVVTPIHGIGYERKGGWHYLLPDATHAAGRRPSRAFRELFSDDGLPEDSLGNGELRPYRLAVQTIGVSAAADGGGDDDGLSEVRSPEQVLGH